MVLVLLKYDTTAINIYTLQVIYFPHKELYFSLERNGLFEDKII